MSSEDRPPRAGAAYATDRYGPILVLLVAVLAFAMYTAESPLFRVIVSLAVMLVVLGTLRATGVTPQRMRIFLFAAAGFGAAAVAGGFTENAAVLAGITLLVAWALALSAYTLVRRIFEQPHIDFRQVIAAIAAYIQIALAFAFVFGAAARVTEAAFFTNGTSGQTGDFIYFSVVTISTLGYGDLAPATDFGRSLVVIETLFGQIFLVVLVAYLVGRLEPKARPMDT